MTAQERVTAKTTDWLLYHYPEIKEALATVTPAPKDLVRLSFSHSVGSSVESVAIDHHRVLMVTGAIERVYNRRGFAGWPRQVTRYHWWDLWDVDDKKGWRRRTNKEVADMLHMSLSTYVRRVRACRYTFTKEIALLSREDMKDFWSKIDSLLTQFREKRDLKP